MTTPLSSRSPWAIELDVMDAVLRELRRLNQRERDRAMSWVNARLAADNQSQQKIKAEG